VVPDAGARVLRPVEVFGAMDLKTDSWHTNGRGNQLIAQALTAEVASQLVGAGAARQENHAQNP
jgi:hypothetical protein